MSRSYMVPYTGTLTNTGGNSDLLEVLPADDKPVTLCGFVLGQTTELADAAEENIGISIVRMTATVTSGSGGSAVTPVPMDGADTAAGATCECNNATVATTSGATTVMSYFSWNVRNTPCDVWFPPEFRPTAKQGEALLVRCDSTVADDITIAVTFYIME